VNDKSGERGASYPDAEPTQTNHSRKTIMGQPKVTKATKPSPASAPSQPIGDLFAMISDSHPFSSTRVNSPDEELVTVDEIHGKEFRQLCEWSQRVYRDGKSHGVVLLGAAGTGKSHLLSRLYSWATIEKNDKRAFYVYLHNVMASPERMPRHFLRSVVSVLVEGRESYKDCALYEIMRAVMRNLHAQGLIEKVVPKAKARTVFREQAKTLSLREDRINGVVFDVLFSFYERVNMTPELRGPVREHVDALVDWLSGDGVSDEVATQIGIPLEKRDRNVDQLVHLPDDHHLEQVLLILAALAKVGGRSLLICLDQVDNLSGDQVKSLSRFSHALLDHAKNLLLVTAGLKESINQFVADQVISQAQWDRLAEQSIELGYITPGQARQLLLDRLIPLHKLSRELPEVRQLLESHPLFPLGEGEFEKHFGQVIDVRPRSVIKWADGLWRQEQEKLQAAEDGKSWLRDWPYGAVTTSDKPDSEIIDEAVRTFVNEKIAERRNHPGALPPDSDNLATVVERLLSHCRGREDYSLLESRRAKEDKPCHLVVVERAKPTNRRVHTGVTFITARNGHAAWKPLDRLIEATKFEHRLLVTDEERCPLPKTKLIQDRLKQLVSLGQDSFKHIGLSFQEYVLLDALRSAIDDAANIVIATGRQGGDRALTSKEVADSLHRQARFVEHRLLQELLTEPSAVPPPPSPLVDANLIQKVIFGMLGWNLCCTTNDVATKVLDQLSQPQPTFEVVHAAVVEVSQQLSQASQIRIKAHLNGLLLEN